MPYKKLLIASFALSGLVNAQCNMKCGYNQDENGNTVHIKKCNEFVSDSITISKETLKEMYVFLNTSIEWIEEEQMNQVCLDEDCRWMWKLRDELPLNLTYPFDE
jgi:hypothetical protein